MVDRRDFIGYIGTGAIGSIVGYYVGAQGLLGIQSETPPQETETPPTGPGFVDDFDYPTSEFESNGWDVNGDFSIDSSRLTANYDGNHFLTHALEYQYGTLHLDGVKNNSRGRGLKIHLVTNPEAGKDNWNAYRINIGQIPDGVGNDNNTVDLWVMSSLDDVTVPIDSDYTHNGEFHNYKLSWNESGQIQLQVDGETLGTTTDTTHVNELSHIVLRFDGENQYIDRIAQTR